MDDQNFQTDTPQPIESTEGSNNLRSESFDEGASTASSKDSSRIQSDDLVKQGNLPGLELTEEDKAGQERVPGQAKGLDLPTQAQLDTIKRLETPDPSMNAGSKGDKPAAPDGAQKTLSGEKAPQPLVKPHDIQQSTESEHDELEQLNQLKHKRS